MSDGLNTQCLTLVSNHNGVVSLKVKDPPSPFTVRLHTLLYTHKSDDTGVFSFDNPPQSGGEMVQLMASTEGFEDATHYLNFSRIDQITLVFDSVLPNDRLYEIQLCLNTGETVDLVGLY